MQISVQEEHFISLQESLIILTENRSALKCQAASISAQLCDLLTPISGYNKTEVSDTNCSASPVTSNVERDRRLSAVMEIIQDLNGTSNAIIDNNEWKSSIDTIIANNCDRRQNLEDRFERFDQFVESDKREKSDIALSVDELDLLRKKMR